QRLRLARRQPAAVGDQQLGIERFGGAGDAAEQSIALAEERAQRGEYKKAYIALSRKTRCKGHLLSRRRERLWKVILSCQAGALFSVAEPQRPAARVAVSKPDPTAPGLE